MSCPLYGNRREMREASGKECQTQTLTFQECFCTRNTFSFPSLWEYFLFVSDRIHLDLCSVLHANVIFLNPPQPLPFHEVAQERVGHHDWPPCVASVEVVAARHDVSRYLCFIRTEE